ncbi:DUF6380 family protein [Streptomyces sp. NPDC028635]|uniref:DUF6380 family protein n=1 Tax=Streptomyces sp. NPDC028635 TaxID=3154800 RepID=UPI0033F883F2
MKEPAMRDGISRAAGDETARLSAAALTDGAGRVARRDGGRAVTAHVGACRATQSVGRPTASRGHVRAPGGGVRATLAVATASLTATADRAVLSGRAAIAGEGAR